jgi:prepilin-type N-terminal cleavage/methylation domain-containing protein
MKTTSKAFTLIELLVVIAVIAILAAILLPAVQRARSMSHRATASSNLRSIGVAMQAYANEHNGRLPGPLNYGQFPKYKEDSDGLLGYFLWPYLDGPEPTGSWQELDVLSHPAYRQERDSDDDVVYLVQRSVRLPGQSGRPPFGYPERADGTGGHAPLSLQQITIYDLRDEWALQDVDQQHPDVAGWNPDAYLPAPAHGNVRMTLNFDWSVRAAPVDEGSAQ